MYKVGDKFEIVNSSYIGEGWQPGEIVIATKDFRKGGESSFYSDKEGYSLKFNTSEEYGKTFLVKPIRETAAEKRGAKFGVGGVDKKTGFRVVFNSVREDANVFTGEEVWVVISEGFPGQTMGIEASNIRLDHEPEYKEIPFSEATHEQRMDVSLVCNQSGKNPIEALHTAGGFYVYTFRENVGPTMVNGNQKVPAFLTVRIPA